MSAITDLDQTDGSEMVCTLVCKNQNGNIEPLFQPFIEDPHCCQYTRSFASFPLPFSSLFLGGKGGGISRRAVGGVKNHSVSASYLPPHCCQYTRSFASFLLSHIGLLSLVVGYCIMGAFIFEELEKVGIDKPVNVSLCFLNFYSTMK